jgi:hypothetical protein
LTLSGVATGQRAIASFELQGNIAAWVFTNPMPADRFTVDFSSALETALGGTPRQYPFNVLPGDVNDDDTVSLADVFANRALQFRTTTNGDYDPRHDVDGSGTINFVDAIHVRNRIGAALPSGAPGPAAAIVARAADNRLAAGELPAGVLRAENRRRLSPAAVDLAVDRLAATRRNDESSPVRALGATNSRRTGRAGEPFAAARLLLRNNLDASRSGDVS